MTEWMTPADVCEELSISRATLDRWRNRRQGPPFRRLPGGTLRVARVDLDEWLATLPEVA